MIIAVLAVIVIFVLFFLLQRGEDYSNCCYKANNEYALEVLRILEKPINTGQYAQVLQSKIDNAMTVSDERFSDNLKRAISYADLNNHSANYIADFVEHNINAGNFESFMKTLKLSLSLDKSTSCYNKINDNPGLFVVKPVLEKLKQAIEPLSQDINGLDRRIDNLQNSWTNRNKSTSEKAELAKQVIEQNVKAFQDLLIELKKRVKTSNENVKLIRNFALIDVSMYLCQTLCVIIAFTSLIPVIEYILNVRYDRVQTIPKWLQVLAMIITVAVLIFTSVFFALTLILDDSKPDDDCPALSKNAILPSFSMRFKNGDFTTTSREYNTICKTSDDSILSDINIEQLFSTDSVLRTLNLRMYKSQMNLLIRYGGIGNLQMNEKFGKQLKIVNDLIDFLNSLLEESCLDANQKNEISQHRQKFQSVVDASRAFESGVSQYNERNKNPGNMTDIVFEDTRKSIDKEIKLAMDGIKKEVKSSDHICTEIMKYESECSYSMNRDNIPLLITLSFVASFILIIFQTTPAPLTKIQEKERIKQEFHRRQRKQEQTSMMKSEPKVYSRVEASPTLSKPSKLPGKQKDIINQNQKSKSKPDELVETSPTDRKSLRTRSERNPRPGPGIDYVSPFLNHSAKMFENMTIEDLKACLIICDDALVRRLAKEKEAKS